MSVLIYLDVCCLNRPFDDLTQPRVRLESEAVLLILSRCRQGDWTLAGSEALTLEINQTRNLERKSKLQALAGLVTLQVTVSESLEVRAGMFIQQVLGTFDALHLACAEACRATVFLTTDDRLIRWAVRQATMLQVKVANPVPWFWEVTTNAES